MNIVMTVKDRPHLTYQALISLHRNTEGPWTLTLVDDGSTPKTAQVMETFQRLSPNKVLILTVPVGGRHSGVLGQLKNMGVRMSFKQWSMSNWLYLSDNDVYFTKGWDTKLIAMATDPRLANFRLFGGQNHPYHQPISCPIQGFKEYYAVAGTSWLMRWSTWATYGPLDGNATGTGQSEDSAFCTRIIKGGHQIGAADPQLVWDTGITQTDGKLSVGSEVKKRVEGILFQ